MTRSTKHRLFRFASAPFLCGLAACGGGGSSPVAPPPVVQTPAPTVTFSANGTSIKAGGSVNLTWSSTNATACTANGDWSGALGVSGSQAVTPASGNRVFSLVCNGSGGASDVKSLNVVVFALPLPVLKTSYENAKKLNIPSQVILTFPSIGGYSENASSGIAFADFFQEGKISMVVFTSRRNFDNTIPSRLLKKVM